jgi:hypothetical protein
MKRFTIRVSALLLVLAAPAFAALEIVQADPANDMSPYVVQQTGGGRVLGTFWNPETDASDFGFSSGAPPEFFWSADRTCVAVNSRDNNGRWGEVYLYRVAADTLKRVPIPTPPKQAEAELEAVRARDLACDITSAVRWRADGTLLLKYEVASRETQDVPQQIVNLWTEVEVRGDTAVAFGWSKAEPSS